MQCFHLLVASPFPVYMVSVALLSCHSSLLKALSSLVLRKTNETYRKWLMTSHIESIDISTETAVGDCLVILINSSPVPAVTQVKELRLRNRIRFIQGLSKLLWARFGIQCSLSCS